MQSIDSIETYAYGTSKDSVSGKEEIKHRNSFSWWYKTYNCLDKNRGIF